ncbi:GTPase IMAP family member 4-like [Corythoichthys intestinalis]|uniref:GTPase IMAP family member 4-like n=1 Tax=Corythoichthys intestinalis TaxID=161448 RepID=UPI0025A4FF72|nr:GTPase IMAP family member 4-like [Corythoichthys intestinalis]XP_057682646.1 GTPase IMAP family member 4-like [Corythoichthys intestinalis]
MECKCETGNIQDGEGWLSGKNAQMGAFAIVGYLLYRFSQTLPAIIRWPIRLFCSITGLSALWGWVSRIVGTLRGIQSLCKWLSRVWKFIKATSSKYHWILALITGSSEVSWDNEKMRLDLSSPLNASLRLILLGPAGGGRTSVANILLGRSAEQSEEPLLESVLKRAIVDGRELSIIDTPDLLSGSLGRTETAKEALRSIQLAAPGPHAILLVMRASRSSKETQEEATQVTQAVLELLGDDIRGHVIPVLTHADRLSRRRTFDRLLDTDVGGVKRLTAICGQRPELLEAGTDQSPEEQSVTRRLLVGRVLELKGLKGHFVHELYKRDELVRMELLYDMTSALSKKLKHNVL